MNFITDHRKRFGVEPICRTLTKHGIKISPQTYYAAIKREPSARVMRDAHLSELIEAVFFDPKKGRSVAGARKVWHYLKRDGVTVARCTVERLMRQQGLRGVRRDGKRFITTRPDENLSSRPPDLVDRNFTANRPNELWVVDFNYVPTWEGMAFTAFMQDVFTQEIVGWRVAKTMRTELPLDALEMALWIRDRQGRDVTGVKHHSDPGAQYTSIRYADRLADAGAIASIGSTADSYDNAMAESINGLYKAECTKLEGPFKTVDQLELSTCDWVDYWNHHRLHSSIGYVPPVEYAAAYYTQPEPLSQAA